MYSHERQDSVPLSLERNTSGPQQREEDGSYCRVHLRVHAKLQLGQAVAVLGDTNNFGGNKPAQAIRLYTTPESFPIWTTVQPIVVLRNKPLTYRYGIVEHGECRWEGLVHIHIPYGDTNQQSQLTLTLTLT